MTDTYLDFNDVDTFNSLEGTAPFEYGEGGTLQSEGWSIDIVGGDQMRVIGWDEEGQPVVEPIGGFLVNLRSDNPLPKILEQYVIHPETPIRVWA